MVGWVPFFKLIKTAMIYRIEGGVIYLQSYNAENSLPPHEVGGLSGIVQLSPMEEGLAEDCTTLRDPLMTGFFIYDENTHGLCNLKAKRTWVPSNEWREGLDRYTESSGVKTQDAKPMNSLIIVRTRR